MKATGVLIPQVERTPWAHPFLTVDHIRRFRAYSEQVWDLAKSSPVGDAPLSCGFAVNMAQNMYKWAKIASRHGADATLYLNPQDTTALSRPEWEEFDGQWSDVFDGAGFRTEHPNVSVRTRCLEPPNDGALLLSAYQRAIDGRVSWQKFVANVMARLSPRHAFELFPSPEIRALRARAPSVRHWPLVTLAGMYPYFSWAEMLATHDVTYIASTPFPAYASGKPYCVFSVGGDLQMDCGRDDVLGQAMRQAFGSAQFILASNPHTLGHCRRFGFTNAVYLPYPMDTGDYTPGEGKARAEWIARFGGEVFVLSTSRVDRAVKGQTDDVVHTLLDLAEQRPSLRFIFLGWGSDVARLESRAAERGLAGRVVVLPPVGKRRLLDYYRSCDIVLDQLVYGYLGSTALEAASVGKPVVMKLRSEQYEPLYSGDVAPVEPASSPDEVRQALLALVDSPGRREARGRALREWLQRNHGEHKTGPMLVALLRLAARGVSIPRGWDNPLRSRLSQAEREYHQRCHQSA